MELKFSFATESDISKLVELVNSAYRGDSSKVGWTTEADLLDGQRTDSNELLEKITEKNSYILLARMDNEIIGSCELVIDPQACELYFGMFTIKPVLQNKGLGKKFLEYVEELAVGWKAKKIKMTVISVRTELIEYYQRRGYQVTNDFIEFPKDTHFGIPKVPNLKMVYLIKALT